MNNELLTIKQFADAASVTQQSIYRRLADVLSPYVIMQGGRKLLKSEALDVYKLSIWVILFFIMQSKN